MRLKQAMITAMCLVLLATGTVGAAPARPFRIGVLIDGSLADQESTAGQVAHRDALDLVQAEVLALARGEFDVRFPQDKRIEGRLTPEGIRSGLDRLLADPDVDLVITLGVFSTQEACRRRDLPKPLIAPFVVDRELQDVPLVDGGSGIPNLNYLTLPSNIIRDLRRFHDLVGFDRVHVVHDALTVEFIPNMYDFVRSKTAALGFEAVPFPVASSAREALDALPADTQAVYLVPLVRMAVGEYARLVDGLKERGLPSFSIVGRRDVEQGVLAAAAPAFNMQHIARRVALNVHRILLGENASVLPVRLEEREQLIINMETARAIGWSPNWKTLTEAELLHERPVAGRLLTLSEAVTEAVESNLEIRARRQEVAAGREDVNRARSVLRPQLDAATRGIRIDDDRAAASLGSQAEKVWLGSLQLTQIIHSDPARAGVQIQSRLQQAREQELESLRLDVALQAARAFLELLRAQTLERVEVSNLRLTESNLQIARTRREIGVANPAEVYRWESALASDRRNLIDARARISAARSILNRAMNRPQEEELRAVEPTMADPSLIVSEGRLLPYIDNRMAFDKFREFMVREGLANAPELKAIDEAILAQERVLLTARRSFWSPEVALVGDVTRLLSEGGAGTDGLTLPPPFTVPMKDDTDWSIALSVTLPLFAGGARHAEVRQAARELDRLRLEREAAAERIELNIRTALFAASSSYPAIDLTRESAEAARRNLELVTDTYAQGAVSIIDLLDAQSAALVSSQLAANAVFDFLLDLMDVERATSYFDFFDSDAGRQEWFRRLEEFFMAEEVSR